MYSIDPGYGYDYGSSAFFDEGLAEGMGTFFLIYFGFMGIILLASIVVYVLQSIGLMTIAKNRGIKKPWLAWIPYASTYLLGKVSDDINLRQGKQTSHRKLLLGLLIAIEAIGVVVGIVAFIVGFFAGMNAAYTYNDEMTLVGGLMAVLIVSILFLLAIIVLAIVYTVFYYIALYNILKTYSPNYAVLILVLTLLVFSPLASIFLFVIRNKQPVAPVVYYQPAPPVQPAYQPAPPVQQGYYQPQPPVQNPYQSAPPVQQPQAPVEPAAPAEPQAPASEE